MSTILPTDAYNYPIPAMRFREGGGHIISASTTSSRNAVAFSNETLIISIYSTVPVYVAFGDDSVLSSSAEHYFPAGVYYDLSIGDNGESAHYTHMAVMAAGSDGDVYISEKQ